MTELALRDASAVALQPDRLIQRSGGIWERDIVDGWVQVLADVSNLANFIAETDFVPKALRNRPAAIAACFLTGRELGIGPMQSLKSIHMVQGVPSLSAEYKRARALAAGHDITFDETNSTQCVIRGRRKNTERWVTIRWTLDMARRAKLDGKDVWRQYPQRMLQARASSELCDLLFPDASLGLATTEILEDGGIVIESGDVIDAASGELATSTTPAIAAPPPRTAQRKARTSPPPAAPDAPVSGPAARPPAQAAAGGDLPPLPGEEDAPGPAAGEGSGPGAPGDDRHRKLVGIVQGHFKRLDYTDAERDKRLEVAAVIANISEVASLNDMHPDELSVVADTLSRCRNRDALTALLVAGDKGE